MSGSIRDGAKELVAQIEALAKDVKAKLETDDQEFISLANDLATINLKFAFTIGELYAHESSGRRSSKKSSILTPWDRPTSADKIPSAVEKPAVEKKTAKKTAKPAKKTTKKMPKKVTKK